MLLQYLRTNYLVGFIDLGFLRNLERAADVAGDLAAGYSLRDGAFENQKNGGIVGPAELQLERAALLIEGAGFHIARVREAGDSSRHRALAVEFELQRH